MGSYSKDGHVWIYHATKAVAQKFKRSIESTGIFKNCYCSLQYGTRSNESTNRLLVSTCNKPTPHSSSGCTCGGGGGYHDVDLTFTHQKIFRMVGATPTHDQFLAGFLWIFTSLPTPLVPNTDSQSMHW